MGSTTATPATARPQAAAVLLLAAACAAAAAQLAAAAVVVDRLEPDDLSKYDNFGYSTSVSGDGRWAAVGTRSVDAVYLYSRGAGSSAGWELSQKLVIPEADCAREGGCSFGTDVSLSADGRVLAVGADHTDFQGNYSGAVYLFERSDGGASWLQRQRVVPAGAGVNDMFGFAVALSGDGGTLVGGTGYNSHDAYVFARAAGGDGPDGAWALEQRLEHPQAASHNVTGFGAAVAVSQDGSALVVGAFLENEAGALNAGSAYAYARRAAGSGDAWSAGSRLAQAAPGVQGGWYGYAVALSGDGRLAMVGGVHVGDTGAVLVFSRGAAAGDPWQREAALLPQGGGDLGGDQFGCSLDLTADGLYAAVGACGDRASGFMSGAAYVLERGAGAAPGDWSQRSRLELPDAHEADRFAHSVSISDDGRRVVSGAYRNDGRGTSSGVADVFDLGDVLPPEFVAPPAVDPAATTNTTATVGAELNEEGRLHCVALTSPGAAPSAADVLGALGGTVPRGVSAEGSGRLACTLQGLAPTTLYYVWCVAEDTAPPPGAGLEAGAGRAALQASRATPMGNVQEEPVLVGQVFTGGCRPGDAAVRAPTFEASASGAVPGAGGGATRLVLQWASSRHFGSHRFAFRGALEPDGCSMAAAAPSGSAPDAVSGWSYQADGASCDDRWTFDRPLLETLAKCGFAEDAAASEDGLAAFRAVVDVTTTEAADGAVFGQPGARTSTAATVVLVRVPTSATATVGKVQAFPPFSSIVPSGGAAPAAVVAQTYRSADETFTLAVETRAAWPYVLDGVTVSRTGGTADWDAAAALASPAGACDGGAARNATCAQAWNLTLSRRADCDLDATYELRFGVRCSEAFGGGGSTGCGELPSGGVVAVPVPVRARSVCARVVEVAEVTPALRAYGEASRAPGTELSDFVLQQRLYGRFSVKVEAGVRTEAVELTSLAIVSECASCRGTVRPLRSDGGAADPVTGWSAAAGGPGQPHADFELVLDASSVSFDGDASTGRAAVTLEAAARVTFTTASGLRARRTLLLRATPAAPAAASGPPPVTAKASTQVGASSAVDAGSPGTAPAARSSPGLVAGASVAGVAFVALVAGAAVTLRRRRRRRLDEAAARGGKLTAMAALAAVGQGTAPPGSTGASPGGRGAAAEGSTIPGVPDAGRLDQVRHAYGSL